MEANELDKRILFLASWYPNKIHPYLGNFVQKHAEIANRAYKIDVLYAISDSNNDEIEISDTVINNVRAVIVYYPKTNSKIPFYNSILKRKRYIEALHIGFNHLNQKYDLVHLNVSFPAGLFALELKRKFSLKYLITEHWTGFLPFTNQYEKLPIYVKSLYKKIFRNAEVVLPVSGHLGEQLKNYHLISEYEAIPNVVNEKYFYPSKRVKEENTRIRFIHVSTFDDEHKNVSGMLSALSKVTYDYEIHIITESEEDVVWQMLQRFKIPRRNCLVSSKQTAEQVGNAMRAADCFLLFSNYETFSVVLAEAWTCGIPAIYTKCGGLTEINSPKLGVQIEINDEKSLARVLNNFKREDYISEEIVLYSKMFSEKRIRNQFETIYNKMLFLK